MEILDYTEIIRNNRKFIHVPDNQLKLMIEMAKVGCEEDTKLPQPNKLVLFKMLEDLEMELVLRQ